MMHGPFADSTRRAAALSSFPPPRFNAFQRSPRPIPFYFRYPRGQGETLIRVFLTRISDKSSAIVRHSIRLSILECLSSINENNIFHSSVLVSLQWI